MWFVIFKCCFAQMCLPSGSVFHLNIFVFFCLVFSGVLDAENVREADLKSQLSLILPLFESASRTGVCVCLLVCKWIQLTHTLLFHLRWYFLFSFCFYILIFPPIFPIFYSPFAMFSCSSYLHLVWMPFSSILIKE